MRCRSSRRRVAVSRVAPPQEAWTDVSPGFKVYLFADSGHPDAFFSASALKERLDQCGIVVRFVDRMSTELADLDLVTRYGVVEPLVILVVAKNEVRARLTRLVSAQQVEAALSQLDPS